jgi:hypothetical protein
VKDLSTVQEVPFCVRRLPAKKIGHVKRMENNRYPEILGNSEQENAEHDLDDDPHSNIIQNTPRQKGIGSRTSESWQQYKRFPEEGQDNLGTRVVTTYKYQVVPVGN